MKATDADVHMIDKVEVDAAGARLITSEGRVFEWPEDSEADMSVAIRAVRKRTMYRIHTRDDGTISCLGFPSWSWDE